MLKFSFDQPLPPQRTTTVIEASAGTGKTFVIAGLVARFVSEGVPLSQILAVTFSRRATAELRDGIRNRLVRSRNLLGLAVTGEAIDQPDAVDQVLLQGSAGELAERHGLLTVAIREIDTAPIVTLHTFAKRMLDELGLLADHDSSAELGSDIDVLADEVIADVYLGLDQSSELDWRYAQELGRIALAHRFEPLHPTDGSANSQIEFATRVRQVFAKRKRQRQLLDYDDMIGQLAETLKAASPNAEAAADALARRFQVVLVDEFQDTDPQQWEFLSSGFHGRTTMMLIGDPKQAIYRFRGGDIETYARARDAADHVLTMHTNYRSDEGVVRGIENIFGPVDLGTTTAPIQLRQVEVSHEGPRLKINDSPPEVTVHVRALNSDRLLNRYQVPKLLCADILIQIDDLLSGSHSIVDREHGHWRAVNPFDIAILVNANWFGREIHAALSAAGHTSVFSGDASVFSSAAAEDWLTVLEALAAPSSWLTRRAMLTALIGWDVASFAAADGEQLIEVTALVSRCSRLLADQGVAAVFETLITETDMYFRLLAARGGEALVTDLHHVAEVLNDAQRRFRLGPTALTEFLRRRIDRARQESEERTRRLPTDRQAIKILTVHQAKGLQFPIVLVPQAYDAGAYPDGDEPVVGHLDGVRILDVADKNSRRGRADQYRAEELAESLRKFYVACTRAESLLICWWAPVDQLTDTSALHRLLSNSRPPGLAPDPSYPVSGASGLAARPRVKITDFTAESTTASIAPASPTGPDSSFGELRVRRFADHIDRAWSRTSYTGLTAAVHGQPVPASDVLEDDEALLDADLSDAAASEPDPQAGSVTSALADLPGSTRFGSLVHEVLELVDPASRHLNDDLREQVDAALLRFPNSQIDPALLTEGLEQTLTTPLGALTDDRSLHQLGASRMLCELDFELPLGTDQHHANLGDLAELFSSLPANDPLHDYGRALQESAASWAALRGFLTGSIDVVLQVPGPTERFVVLDYKTNRVPTAAGETLTPQHYSPKVMATAMTEAHYPLQALLYCVALHRYLDWRLPGYDPQTHLGGVGYLFVRGMVGPETPRLGSMPAGVFTWLPPAHLVLAASELLAGGH